MKKAKGLVIIILAVSCTHLFSQSMADEFFELLPSGTTRYDTSYVESRPDDLLLRMYGVYKYNRFRFSIKELDKHIAFSSAPQVNIGVGFNYKWLGINLGFNFGFINPNLEKYGKESRLDCQFQLYQRKFIIDGIFQYYKGFYIKKTNFQLPDHANGIPTMPGLRMLNAGVNFLYSFNNTRFSYQAAYINTEIQKKSAGTPLVGGNFLWEQLKGDAEQLALHYPNLYNDSINLSRMYFVNFGILGGYAYTFIIAGNFYISMALTPGINIEIGDVSGGNEKARIGVLFKFTGRTAIGYNKGRFFTSLMYYIDGNLGHHRYGNAYYDSGNIRLNIGMRLNVKKKKPI